MSWPDLSPPLLAGIYSTYFTTYFTLLLCCLCVAKGGHSVLAGSVSPLARWYVCVYMLRVCVCILCVCVYTRTHTHTLSLSISLPLSLYLSLSLFLSLSLSPPPPSPPLSVSAHVRALSKAAPPAPYTPSADHLPNLRAKHEKASQHKQAYILIPVLILIIITSLHEKAAQHKQAGIYTLATLLFHKHAYIRKRSLCNT